MVMVMLMPAGEAEMLLSGQLSCLKNAKLGKKGQIPVDRIETEARITLLHAFEHIFGS